MTSTCRSTRRCARNKLRLRSSVRKTSTRKQKNSEGKIIIFIRFVQAIKKLTKIIKTTFGRFTAVVTLLRCVDFKITVWVIYLLFPFQFKVVYIMTKNYVILKSQLTCLKWPIRNSINSSCSFFSKLYLNWLLLTV